MCVYFNNNLYLPPPQKKIYIHKYIYIQAVENAKRLTEGDLENLELTTGPVEVNRRRMVLNQVRCGAVRCFCRVSGVTVVVIFFVQKYPTN